MDEQWINIFICPFIGLTLLTRSKGSTCQETLEGCYFLTMLYSLDCRGIQQLRRQKCLLFTSRSRRVWWWDLLGTRTTIAQPPRGLRRRRQKFLSILAMNLVISLSIPSFRWLWWQTQTIIYKYVVLSFKQFVCR